VPISGAQVYVYDQTGALANLVTSGDAPTGNPVTSDSLGYAPVFVAVQGYYTLKYFWGGRLRLIETQALAGSAPIDVVLAEATEQADRAEGFALTLEANASGGFYASVAEGVADTAVEVGEAFNVITGGRHYVAQKTGAATGVIVAEYSTAASDAVAVTPQKFDAVGDGVADDTAALTAFFAAATVNGGYGEIPAGTYRFTTPLTITADTDNWVIRGAGSQVVTLLYDGASTTADILTMGNGTAEIGLVGLKGFTLRSDTVMTAGIGLHLRKLVRSAIHDVVIDGQDGNGNLWHGIRFNGLDSVYWDDFQVRAQKDGVQVNGLVGAQPKADLHISNYKIASCDVGIRFGGAFGGFYPGPGSIAVCGDSVVVDTTLVAEANREVLFSPLIVLDDPDRCNVVIDQATASNLRVSFPAGMWVASSTSHGIWIKNANGARIEIDAYIYNIANADAVRIDDANANVVISTAEFADITGTGYAINPTVATTKLKVLAPRFLNVANTFNFTSNRVKSDLSFPVSVQGGRGVLWHTYSGTLDVSGNATIAHGKGGTYPALIAHVMVGVKESGGAWRYIAPTFVDGTNIDIAAGGTYASRPYNVTVLVGDQANGGW
jgi:hypothetical protein